MKALYTLLLSCICFIVQAQDTIRPIQIDTLKNTDFEKEIRFIVTNEYGKQTEYFKRIYTKRISPTRIYCKTFWFKKIGPERFIDLTKHVFEIETRQTN